jgi:hypothetical protein
MQTAPHMRFLFLARHKLLLTRRTLLSIAVPCTRFLLHISQSERRHNFERYSSAAFSRDAAMFPDMDSCLHFTLGAGPGILKGDHSS